MNNVTIAKLYNTTFIIKRLSSVERAIHDAPFFPERYTNFIKRLEMMMQVQAPSRTSILIKNGKDYLKRHSDKLTTDEGRWSSFNSEENS